MFNLFKAKPKNEIRAICNGNMIPLEDVKDEMFSNKMLGDGFAIIPQSEYVVSPFVGKVLMIFPSKHAIGLINEEGIEFLIHVGIDTVSENGHGFEVFVKQDDKISVGTTLMHFDKEGLSKKGYDLTISCVITNMDKIDNLDIKKEDKVIGGKTISLIYSKKA